MVSLANGIAYKAMLKGYEIGIVEGLKESIVKSIQQGKFIYYLGRKPIDL